MKTENLLMVVVGIVIFALSLVGGGLLFHLGIFSYVGWFVGLILVAIGLERENKAKKSK